MIFSDVTGWGLCAAFRPLGRKARCDSHVDKRDDVRVIRGCLDDDLFAKDLGPRVNDLNYTIYTSYFS